MKIWHFPVAILSGLGAAVALLLAGAPNWACAIASGITSGVVTYFLLRSGRR